MVVSTTIYEGEYAFRHCVVASTWAFEAQGPGSIPGGGATALFKQGIPIDCTRDRTNRDPSRRR